MSAVTIVVQKLLATPAVVGVVNKKIRPIVFKREDRPPAILVNLVATSDTVTLGGAGKYYLQRVRLDCVAENAQGALDLGDVVIDSLNGVIKETIAGCVDVDILLASGDMTDFNEEQTMFRRVVDFNVRWRKAA